MADKQKRRSQDLRSLWRSFKAARLRKESATAHDRLCSYLRRALSEAPTTPSPPPTLRNKFNLVPSCIAFAPPDKAWRLEKRPKELVDALEEHAELLLQQLGSEVVAANLTGEQDSVAGQLLANCADFATITARLAAWPANYEALAQSHLTGKVMKLAHNLWAMVKEKMSKVVIRHLFQALIHSVACLHSMLDPQRAWKECFLPASLASTGGKEGPSVLPAPAELVPLFVSVLTQSQVPLHFNLCLQLYSDLRNELLHMIGALLSSVESNARRGASSNVCLPLLTFLDPRENISPLQTLAVSTVIKATHALHCHVPDDQQVEVDVNLMLSGFLNILTPRYGEEVPTQPCYEMAITILDSIPLLVAPPTGAGRLRQQMVDLGCLIKITELLNTIRDSIREDGDRQCVLACSVLKSLTAIVEGSQALREGYESTVTYHRLRQLVTDLGTPPSTPALSQAINMVVEGEYEYQSHSHSIYNTWALAMLLRWLPSLPDNERAWLAERLYDLTFGAHNRQRCCGAGLITVVTEVLCASQKEGGFSEEVEVLLVHILEVLGSHSIQTAELKHIIGALRPLPHGQLPTYYFSVQKALSVMSHDITHERMVPLCYFDLRSKTAIISLPPHLHFPSSTSSLSFHTWVCLDYPRTTGRLTYSTPVSRSTRITPTFPSLPRKRRRILFRSVFTYVPRTV
ncbi:Neurobeachin-like protein 1 [Geodia barretti]|uniref:Neurobeachin-like protein 1 n=1 Tax=Geodia barretti TaxID=519541 RepID=A0AA35SBJ1_GEOBA|nr:Neurobeachin-like protein 1 [Geodia barretti]